MERGAREIRDRFQAMFSKLSPLPGPTGLELGESIALFSLSSDGGGGEGRGEESRFYWISPLPNPLPARSSQGEGDRRQAFQCLIQWQRDWPRWQWIRGIDRALLPLFRRRRRRGPGRGVAFLLDFPSPRSFLAGRGRPRARGDEADCVWWQNPTRYIGGCPAATASCIGPECFLACD